MKKSINIVNKKQYKRNQKHWISPDGLSERIANTIAKTAYSIHLTTEQEHYSV